jgi:four helix bundle protein
MSESTIREFTDLEAWKRSHVVVLFTYKLTKKFPREEMFGLTNQMRRAAVSAESNIAEGFGRNTPKDKQHFFGIAKGSLLELQSQFITARDLGYITEEEYRDMRTALLHAIRLCAGLVRSTNAR